MTKQLGQFAPDLVDRDHADLDGQEMGEAGATDVSGRAIESLDVADGGALMLGATVTPARELSSVWIRI